MPWIRYTGPVDRVHVPYWGIGGGAPDGKPGWPRLEPLEVSQDARDGLVGDGHPDREWRDCAPPSMAPPPWGLAEAPAAGQGSDQGGEG